jgi:hypothetical protein
VERGPRPPRARTAPAPPPAGRRVGDSCVLFPPSSRLSSARLRARPAPAPAPRPPRPAARPAPPRADPRAVPQVALLGEKLLLSLANVTSARSGAQAEL